MRRRFPVPGWAQTWPIQWLITVQLFAAFSNLPFYSGIARPPIYLSALCGTILFAIIKWDEHKTPI